MWGQVVSPLIRAGPAGLVVAALAQSLLALSPVASVVNLVVAEKSLGPEVVAKVEVRSMFGIPIIVPRLDMVERRTLVAINLGGGVIPIIVGSVSLLSSYVLLGPRALEAAFWGTLVTSLVTFAFSRAVPRVGIVVPAFIPPLTAAMVSVLQLGLGPGAAGVAYFSGTVGSLIGADVLRLLKDIRKLDAPFVSIGGAGVFDGVYLSGVLAALLAL